MKYLIAGLGNIGQEYENTRHNVGFNIVEKMAADFNSSFESGRLVQRTDFKYKGCHFYLIKPTTFMNKSGKAVKYWLHTLELDVNKLLIVLDDIALPFGKIRIRPNGADGGHNGLANILETMETNNISRLRFGIGDDFSTGNQVNHVLGEWRDEEKKILPEKLENACNAIISFGKIGIDRTMNQFN